MTLHRFSKSLAIYSSTWYVFFSATYFLNVYFSMFTKEKPPLAIVIPLYSTFETSQPSHIAYKNIGSQPIISCYYKHLGRNKHFMWIWIKPRFIVLKTGCQRGIQKGVDLIVNLRWEGFENVYDVSLSYWEGFSHFKQSDSTLLSIRIAWWCVGGRRRKNLYLSM